MWAGLYLSFPPLLSSSFPVLILLKMEKRKKTGGLPSLFSHKEMFSAVKGGGGKPSAWLTFQLRVCGDCSPRGAPLCTSCSQSALASLCHELGDLPSGSDAQHPVRPADKDTVFGLALVFCRRYLALRQAWRKHFWGISAFKEKKMTRFLNTMIYVKIF